jgi:toxin-antitoxin system PIN domain toxin
MSCFPDINVWLAIVVNEHVCNGPAARWWNGDQADDAGFCRFTQIGLLRHLTNTASMNGKPFTNRQAWQVFETLQADPRVRFFPEPPALDAVLKQFSNGNQASPKVWGDAYLAAYAAVNDATVVTFDKGFTKFPVKSLILGSR